MLSYALSSLSPQHLNLPPIRFCEVNNQHLFAVTTDQRLIVLDLQGHPFERPLPKSEWGVDSLDMAVVNHRLIYSAQGGTFVHDLLHQREDFFPGHSFLVNTYECETVLSCDTTIPPLVRVCDADAGGARLQRAITPLPTVTVFRR